MNVHFVYLLIISEVNVSDCKTQRLLTVNDCLIPQLSCVIDNKKSWVYTDQGVVTETIYPRR